MDRDTLNFINSITRQLKVINDSIEVITGILKKQNKKIDELQKKLNKLELENGI